MQLQENDEVEFSFVNGSKHTIEMTGKVVKVVKNPVGGDVVHIFDGSVVHQVHETKVKRIE